MTTSPDYFFHKGGMVSLTHWLASHYGPKQMRVKVVSPCGIYNPENPQAAAFIERYNEVTMPGRMCVPEEIGGSVTLPLNDSSGYITGINLMVDGGHTAK